MSRVIIFSRTFPAYHPRKGEETFFVEKICLDENVMPINLAFLTTEGMQVYYDPTTPTKYHTIRRGHRWKPGDKFSPRVWEGKPYRSKQIQFAEDIEVVKVWDILILKKKSVVAVYINDDKVISFDLDTNESDWWGIGIINTIAENDGLSRSDFFDWFKIESFKTKVWDEVFDGQIICWNENVNY